METQINILQEQVESLLMIKMAEKGIKPKDLNVKYNSINSYAAGRLSKDNPDYKVIEKELGISLEMAIELPAPSDLLSSLVKENQISIETLANKTEMRVDFLQKKLNGGKLNYSVFKKLYDAIQFLKCKKGPTNANEFEKLYQRVLVRSVFKLHCRGGIDGAVLLNRLYTKRYIQKLCNPEKVTKVQMRALFSLFKYSEERQALYEEEMRKRLIGLLNEPKEKLIERLF